MEGEKRKNHADVATDVAKTGVVLVLWGKSNGFNNLGYRMSGFVVSSDGKFGFDKSSGVKLTF